MSRFIYMITVIAYFACIPAYAQQWEIGAHAGITGFMGDVNPSNPLYFESGTGGINATFNFNSTWGLQLSYNYVHLYASDFKDKDPYRHARGHSFSNKVNELSLRANFNFFRFIPGRELNRYTPYLFAGIAGITHNPYARFTNGNTINLQDLELQEDNNISKTAIAIPFGVGFKYNIKGPWSIGAELGYRTAFNNDIDNISNNYPTNALVVKQTADRVHVNNPEIDPTWWNAIAFPANSNPADYCGKAKGDGGPRDGYMTAGVTLTFTFISKRCYWWK